MLNRKEIRPVFEYTDGAGTHGFKEGDAVICFSGSKIYTGTIVAFSSYRENKDADPQCSVYIDTSRNNMNRSCEVVKIEDITYMCKVPVNDWLGYPETNETLDRNNFIEMIVALGHDKEKAEIIYEHMKELIELYNIPLSRLLSCAIREIDLNAQGRSTKELIDISNKLIEVMAQLFQSLTEVLKKRRIPDID